MKDMKELQLKSEVPGAKDYNISQKSDPKAVRPDRKSVV